MTRSTATNAAGRFFESDAPATPDTFSTAIERGLRGKALSVELAMRLLTAKGPQLDRLLDAAATLRDRGLRDVGRLGIVTYSRKVFIPLTTLCRDRCHYCTFVDTPAQLKKLRKPIYMTSDQVLTIARQGARTGCKEALITLGDRPEDRWPEARDWLEENGYESTLHYVADMARRITSETGLLVHVNPGVMNAKELAMLRPVAPSMGMMLETTSRTLFETPGQVHYGSPDKEPAVRIGVLEQAGAAKIPFTTGILVGIGESIRDRADSIIALRDIQARYGHIQEVIVQNFRAKPATAMRDVPDPPRDEYLAAIATTRLVMGASMRIQAPPNLSDRSSIELLLQAGVDDWGGVSPLTADHVNPERPWPRIQELAQWTAESGFVLRERLTAHPEYIADSQQWIDPTLAPTVQRAADPHTSLAALPPDVRSAPASGHTGSQRKLPAATLPSRRELEYALAKVAADPSSVDDDAWVALLHATGEHLDTLANAANDFRRYTVGEAITQVVNRNVSSDAYRSSPTGSGQDFGLTDLAEIAEDARDLGATELCVQGKVSHSEDAESYLDIARTIKKATPGIHLHAFRPADIADFADRCKLPLAEAIHQLRAAGVDSFAGTGVKILSERVRTKIAPADIDTKRWREIITAVHKAGARTTSVIFYGHLETPGERIAHLRALADIQAETGGFTELVPIPMPGYGVPLVAGRTPLDEHRAMFAVARLLSGSIRHIQVPWTRLGMETSVALLSCGADDLGGTLMDGRVLPAVGVELGLELPIEETERLARKLLQPFRQRATDYSDPPKERRT